MKKDVKLAFSLGTLTEYVEQNKQPLIHATLFSGKTVSVINVQRGIKNKETINIIDSDATFQAGGCGFTASGPTSITQRTIEVEEISIKEEICLKDLNAYFTQKWLPLGSHYDTVPPEIYEAWTETKIGKIVQQLETLVWQGDTASGNSNYNRFDGFIKVIDAAGTAIAATPSTYNAANSRTIVQNIYENLPAALLDKQDVAVFMGWDWFRILLGKITSDNAFHYTTDQPAVTGELIFPGTGMKVIAVNGLNGTDRIFAGRTSNFYFGTDLENEYEDFRVKELEDLSDYFRFRADFKAGVQVAFPAEIVQYTNA